MGMLILTPELADTSYFGGGIITPGIKKSRVIHVEPAGFFSECLG
jgi:hypothetical protein